MDNNSHFLTSIWTWWCNTYGHKDLDWSRLHRRSPRVNIFSVIWWFMLGLFWVSLVGNDHKSFKLHIESWKSQFSILFDRLVFSPISLYTSLLQMFGLLECGYITVTYLDIQSLKILAFKIMSENNAFLGNWSNSYSFIPTVSLYMVGKKIVMDVWYYLCLDIGILFTIWSSWICFLHHYFDLLVCSFVSWILAYMSFAYIICCLILSSVWWQCSGKRLRKRSCWREFKGGSSREGRN